MQCFTGKTAFSIRSYSREAKSKMIEPV